MFVCIYNCCPNRLAFVLTLPIYLTISIDEDRLNPREIEKAKFICSSIYQTQKQHEIRFPDFTRPNKLRSTFLRSRKRPILVVSFTLQRGPCERICLL